MVGTSMHLNVEFGEFVYRGIKNKIAPMRVWPYSNVVRLSIKGGTMSGGNGSYYAVPDLKSNTIEIAYSQSGDLKDSIELKVVDIPDPKIIVTREENRVCYSAISTIINGERYNCVIEEVKYIAMGVTHDITNGCTNVLGNEIEYVKCSCPGDTISRMIVMN